MLSLGPGSSCDICFEKFGADNKAPWSIECGHVFCAGCIENVESPCPMCRTPFDHGACIKLHVDLDDVEGTGPSFPREGLSEEVQEARRIWKAISDIPLGATETAMRQLVHDGEVFFKQQDDTTLFKDLKAVFQITNHLYDVKRKYRAQVQKAEALAKQLKQVEEDNAQLTEEKGDLQKQLDKLEETRQYETETAAAVEASLQIHVSDAVRDKDAAEKKLKKLEQENHTLIKQLESKYGRSLATKTQHADEGKKGSDFSLSTSFSMPTVFDNLDPESTAIQDPMDFAISPFAGFGSAILPMVDAIASELADSDEDSGASHENTDNEDEKVAANVSKHQAQSRGYQEIKPRHSTEALKHTRPVGRSEPSGLSRTAPYRDHHRRERSRSNPSQPTSRSQSPFNTLLGSASPTPPIQTTATHGTSSREIRPLQQFGSDSQILRSRLQELLSDKAATSSSLPAATSSSSHFPSSFTSRDTTGGATTKTERSSTLPKPVPPRSADAPATHSQSTSNNFSHLLASHQHPHSPTSIKPPPSTSPALGPRVSSASAEAKKLEEERKRRQREEHSKYGQEHDRIHADADRESRRFSPSSVHSTTSATSSASQAARRDQQQHPVYPNTLSSNNSSAPSRRGSTANSTGYNGPYGRPEQMMPPSPQEQGPAPPGRYTNASSNLKSSGSKNLLPSNQAGIYI